MRDRLTELGDATDVVLLTFTDPREVVSYRSAHELPFPILVDSDRAAYRAFGLGRGSVRRVWGLKSARKYFDIVRVSGIGALSVPIEDTLQLGGDFVVGPDGTLVYGFWGEGPDDRPDVDELIEAVRSVTS